MSVGDVAWMDDEGFVYICDRKRDMIISGGVNIYPAEIEDALHRHPAVEDAAGFGVPDAEWVERVHAAIQLRPGERVTERELMDFCRAHLADYKAPREGSFHDDFPRDTAGKHVMRLLRESRGPRRRGRRCCRRWRGPWRRPRRQFRRPRSECRVLASSASAGARRTAASNWCSASHQRPCLR